MNDYFNHSGGEPASNARGLSSVMRTVFDQIVTAFGLLPSRAVLFTGRPNFVSDTGAANAIIIAVPDSSVTAIADGMEFRVKTAFACSSGTPTITIGALGTFTITHGDGTQLVSNDWTAGQICTFTYKAATGTVQYLECSTSALTLSVAAGTPYASAPTRVGYANAGTQANYSRGDHSHAISIPGERAIRRARQYIFS